MKKTSSILLILLPFLFGCNTNTPNDDLIWINRQYDVTSTIELTYPKLQNIFEKKEDFILYIYSPTCMSCIDFKPIIERYISDTSMIIYSIEVKNIGNEVKYGSTPCINIYDEGILYKTVDFINDEKTFSSYDNFSAFMNREVNIMKTIKINDETQLFNIIENEKNLIIYYHYDGCPDCAFFDQNFLNEYIKSDDCGEFYTFDVQERFEKRESKDDPIWTDFTKKIGIHSSCEKGYRDGVIPSIVKYSIGEVEDVCIIFNDVLEETLNENNEVTAVKVLASYYDDAPFVNNVYHASKDKTARNVYKENTLNFYIEKFKEILGGN